MNINATFIGQIIWFVLFVVFCWKFVWPPILKALEERKQKIADGLNAADRAERDLELAQENAAQRLSEAKKEASEIIDAAKKRANQMIEDAKKDAEVEADRIRAGAQAEIDQQVNQAREQLRADLGRLVILGAEQVLGESVDQKAHSGLIDKLAANL